MRLSTSSGVPIALGLAFLATFLPGREERYCHRVPADRLGLIRGADPESPVGSISGCESKNTGANGALAPDCDKAALNAPCVVCPDDTPVTATTDPQARPPGFLLVDMATCNGKKTTGFCAVDPMTGIKQCTTMPWNGDDYCGGELRQAIFQEAEDPIDPNP